MTNNKKPDPFTIRDQAEWLKAKPDWMCDCGRSKIEYFTRSERTSEVIIVLQVCAKCLSKECLCKPLRIGD